MIHCREVSEQLSAFYDRELGPEQAAAVRAHLDDCPRCAAEMSQFKQLSRLAAGLRRPGLPADVWPEIARVLDGQEPSGEPQQPARWSRRRLTAACAAALLLAASAGLATWEFRQRQGAHAAMAVDFDHYLRAFQHGPEAAQRVLAGRYDGREVDLAGASGDLPFQPLAPAELPDGFARQSCYVLKMPCCTCTQTTYRNDTGAVLALFEHAEQQTGWFGDRPRIEAICHGCQTQLVQLPGRLAATWKCGRRYLTLVGAENVEQVARLVAVLNPGA